MKKILAALTLLALTVLSLSGCSLIGLFVKEPAPVATVPNPIVTIEMEDIGTMRLELYPDVAPNTVANFVNLIEQKYYDGLIFHRVIQTFMIQGGDPTGTGMGGPGYSIKGEFSDNGVQNPLKHTRGVLSMARSGDPNSAGSQFFIMHADAPNLDGSYAAFGKLLDDEESYKTLDIIASTPTDASDRPLTERKIKSMTVDTKGYQYTVVKYEG